MPGQPAADGPPESHSLAAVGVWPANGARDHTRYTRWVEITRRRIAAALVLVLTALPISGATCLAFCPFASNPAAHPGDARITTAQPAHCHEASETTDVSLQASPSACPDGLRGSAALAEAPRAGRSDYRMQSASPSVLPSAVPLSDAAARAASPHPNRTAKVRARATAPSVLRI